jgi:hypothetical protein
MGQVSVSCTGFQNEGFGGMGKRSIFCKVSGIIFIIPAQQFLEYMFPRTDVLSFLRDILIGWVRRFIAGYDILNNLSILSIVFEIFLLVHNFGGSYLNNCFSFMIYLFCHLLEIVDFASVESVCMLKK